MIIQDSQPDVPTISAHPTNVKGARWICNYIIVQCIVVFIGASTIEHCRWSPERATHDYDKLVRIMYLFDSQACGYNLRASRAMSNLQLANDTGGLNVLPIKWTPAIVTVSTRLTAKTRRYIDISIGAHVVWLIVALLYKLLRDIKSARVLKIGLALFLYISIFMVMFDVSMALVYIAHIQQSLTNEMILRYSGWSVEMKLKNYESFGGWLPIAAAFCWMRGGVFFGLNIYCCKVIRTMRRRIKKTEFKERLMLDEKPPIPEATYKQPYDEKVLYFRTGEKRPFMRRSFRPLFFE